MKRLCGWLALLVPFLMACATVSEQGRLDRFDEISRQFRWTLLDSDFRAATQFMDPILQDHTVDLIRYKDIKIVDYTITRARASDDNRRIEQDIELDYYLVDRNILKTPQSHRVWRYDPERKAWLLKSRLPRFDQ